MRKATLPYLRCPRKKCASIKKDLRLEGDASTEGEIISGSLICPSCGGKYPILGGVAILVEDVRDYLLAHIKGISREVSEAAFPREFRKEMLEAKRELATEHIEEDLESERVTALYVMTHYLGIEGAWWRAGHKSASPEIEELILKYWEHGPFERIRLGLRELEHGKFSLVELGCGVGGLFGVLSGQLKSYLGVDSSFAGIALARKLALGSGKVSYRVPGDLLEGAVSVDVSKDLRLPRMSMRAGELEADFIVTDAIAPALKQESWDVCASLNMIDMLDRPESLPEIQKQLIKPGGLAIQSSPYVWHPEVARRLRKKLGPSMRDSGQAVRSLYERAGFEIRKSEEQIPWLFFKHLRQIELYSVDLFFCRCRSKAGISASRRSSV